VHTLFRSRGRVHSRRLRETIIPSHKRLCSALMALGSYHLLGSRQVSCDHDYLSGRPVRQNVFKDKDHVHFIPFHHHIVILPYFGKKVKQNKNKENQ
jgi:hypothetical protein